MSNFYFCLPGPLESCNTSDFFICPPPFKILLCCDLIPPKLKWFSRRKMSANLQKIFSRRKMSLPICSTVQLYNCQSKTEESKGCNYVSPSNEGRYIVLVWFFLPLLSEACPDHNYFVFWDMSMIFRMWVHDHKAVCRVPYWPLWDLWPQGQIIVFSIVFSCPGHNIFVFRDRSMIIGMWVHDHKAVCHVL